MAILTTDQVAAIIDKAANGEAWSDDGHAYIDAIAIAKAEGASTPKFFNGSCCYGIFQIHLRAHWDKIPGSNKAEKLNSLRDHVTNATIAYEVYQEAGGSFSPWEAYTNGSYKKYLKDAENSYGDLIVGELNEWSGTGIPNIDIPNPIDAVQDIGATIKAALGWITDPHNWLRIAAFLGGMAVLLVAGWALISETKAGKTAMGAATTVATKGKM